MKEATMRRREFITLLGASAAAWPLATRAQQAGGMRRIGVLTGGPEDNLGTRANLAALREVLARLGWIEGRNLRIDLRFTANDPDRNRAYAVELVRLAPDVIVATSGPATRAVQQQTQTIPIVFTTGGDPVSNGVVQNIARPEGNTTGVTNAFDSFGGKWLELLKEAAPYIKRVALVFNPEIALLGYIPSIEAAAPLLGVQAIKTPVRNPLEIVRAIDAFAAEPNGALLMVPVPPNGANLELILRLAVQHRLPAIYPQRASVADGGLMAYGPDFPDLYRGAATYVDRLLRGAKVSELPVQFPTKYNLVVNLKAAMAIGLTIPEAFLLRADELIE
jgi:putative tryptophan/tyrosine transport system substrate-binding protein